MKNFYKIVFWMCIITCIIGICKFGYLKQKEKKIEDSTYSTTFVVDGIEFQLLITGDISSITIFNRALTKEEAELCFEWDKE